MIYGPEYIKSMRQLSEESLAKAAAASGDDQVWFRSRAAFWEECAQQGERDLSDTIALGTTDALGAAIARFKRSTCP